MELGIESLSTGISASGMDEYLEGLRAKYITETSELIDDIADIQEAINNGWQGVAKDRFMTQFDIARTTVKNDLRKEYTNLEARLTELKAQYFETDKNMIIED